jgi:hypothetical protein
MPLFRHTARPGLNSFLDENVITELWNSAFYANAFCAGVLFVPRFLHTL